MRGPPAARIRSTHARVVAQRIVFRADREHGRQAVETRSRERYRRAQQRVTVSQRIDQAAFPVQRAIAMDVVERQHRRVRFRFARGRLRFESKHRVDERDAVNTAFARIAQRGRHRRREHAARAVARERQRMHGPNGQRARARARDLQAIFERGRRAMLGREPVVDRDHVGLVSAASCAVISA